MVVFCAFDYTQHKNTEPCRTFGKAQCDTELIECIECIFVELAIGSENYDEI